MSVEFCGATTVVEWYCTDCGHTWTTTVWQDFTVQIPVPECPNCQNE